jgi:hypothetical protein
LFVGQGININQELTKFLETAYENISPDLFGRLLKATADANLKLSDKYFDFFERQCATGLKQLDAINYLKILAINS